MVDASPALTQAVRERIAAVVAEAPPLSDEQIAELRAIFRPRGQDGTARSAPTDRSGSFNRL